MTKGFLKIPRQLQFTNDKVLIAVLGKRIGAFYIVTGEEMVKILEIEEEIPKYFDREGFFAKRGKGKVFKTGAVYESKDDETERRFGKKTAFQIKKTIKKESPERVYIIEPEYMKNMVARHLGKAVIEKIIVIKGNYVKKEPLQIIRKIISSTAGIK